MIKNLVRISYKMQKASDKISVYSYVEKQSSGAARKEKCLLKTLC